jgi:hypothetical protein
MHNVNSFHGCPDLHKSGPFLVFLYVGFYYPYLKLYRYDLLNF